VTACWGLGTSPISGIKVFLIGDTNWLFVKSSHLIISSQGTSLRFLYDHELFILGLSRTPNILLMRISCCLGVPGKFNKPAQPVFILENVTKN